MTSAQNRPQLLSGNKFITYFFAILILFVTSCDALKPAQKTDTGDKNEELDPIVGKNKDRDKDDSNTDNSNSNNNDNSNSDDNPNGTDIVKDVSKPGTPDTLTWIPVNPGDGGTVVVDPDDPNNGNNTIDTTSNDDPVIPGGIIKSTYEVAVLLPLYTGDFITNNQVPSKAKRSINYYEGMLLGFRRLEGEGVNMNVNVFDTKVNNISTLMSKSEVANADLIIGPVSSGNVAIAAQSNKTNKQLLVSLNSSENLTHENPYFIQASPSLSSHCETVVKHFKTHNPTSKIILLGRNEDAAVFPMYQDANMLYEGSSDVDRLSEYIVTGSNSDYDIRGLNSQLSRLDTNIIVIPSGNQGFVYSMLRSLSLIRTTYPIIVVGMPRWENFLRIDPDYYIKMNVHISNSAYINHNDFNITEFKRSFFNEYGMPPTTEAYKGYDVALYFGRMLKEHGTTMLSQLANNPKQMLHSNLQFQPTYTSNSVGEGSSTVDQFENKYVHILRFDNYIFVKVNQ
jgi:hypothetical protein